MDETIIDTIERLMLTDTENRENQSRILSEYYTHATKEERRKIDLCFIALCGYSLETIILQPSEVL